MYKTRGVEIMELTTMTGHETPDRCGLQVPLEGGNDPHDREFVVRRRLFLVALFALQPSADASLHKKCRDSVSI